MVLATVPTSKTVSKDIPLFNRDAEQIGLTKSTQSGENSPQFAPLSARLSSRFSKLIALAAIPKY